MTHQEKEALLKRIYALPTEWADGGGSCGEGGPVGSEDAAMLWPEDVIDAINQFAEDTNVARSPWVKTSDRLPTKANGEILATNKYGLNLLPYYRVVELSDVYTWWMAIPPLPEVEK